jgi:hypothetical protein
MISHRARTAAFVPVLFHDSFPSIKRSQVALGKTLRPHPDERAPGLRQIILGARAKCLRLA